MKLEKFTFTGCKHKGIRKFVFIFRYFVVYISIFPDSSLIYTKYKDIRHNKTYDLNTFYFTYKQNVKVSFVSHAESLEL